MTDEELSRRFDSLAELIQNVAERLDARLSAVENRISSLETSVESRLSAIEGHLERIDTRLGALEFAVFGLQRGMDRLDKTQREMLVVQQKQQQAIDELYRRLNPPPAA
jgi:hypothetical protein